MFFFFFFFLEDIKDHLLFLHAWTGCDTTSSIYGKGKGSSVNILRKSESLKSISDLMTNVWSDHDEVGSASVDAFKILYGGKITDTLTKLR